ncbi:uncharacterized protein [Salvelinus sp. IW2-2015]|uniref:uncharacterized protein isoform X2 n=1 Tax=Salvelinus sp. IW2-2015 TaxID=2691554 RepID=UPI0038D382A0
MQYIPSELSLNEVFVSLQVCGCDVSDTNHEAVPAEPPASLQDKGQAGAKQTGASKAGAKQAGAYQAGAWASRERAQLAVALLRKHKDKTPSGYVSKMCHQTGGAEKSGPMEAVQGRQPRVEQADLHVALSARGRAQPVGSLSPAQHRDSKQKEAPAGRGKTLTRQKSTALSFSSSLRGAQSLFICPTLLSGSSSQTAGRELYS